MSRTRDFFKNFFKLSPAFFSFAQKNYHEARFYYSKMRLKTRYPSLKVVRYSNEEISSQRRNGYQSQFGQDFFVINEFFNERKNGIFMDIGCNQPVYINNTYFLEKRAGWCGLAFDPIARHAEKWHLEREAEFIPVALGATEEMREFAEVENKDGWGNMMSSFAENARPEDLRMGFKSYPVQVRRASDILDERAIKYVDFVSIDVEGAEIEVLTGFDLNRNAPLVLLIENARGICGNEKLREYVLAHGYKFYARIWTCDDVYLRAQ